MAMSESPGVVDRPDSAISAASGSARRKNKSFAQYTGATPPKSLYRKGLEQNFGPRKTPPDTINRWIRDSFLLEAVNRDFFGLFRGLSGPANHGLAASAA